MQIGTSALYDSSAKQMSSLSSQAAAVNEQISTGKRITQPSDDPVASAQLTTLKRVGSDASQYSANLDTASSLLQQTDDAMGAVATNLQQAQELALRASNGTLSASDRASIAAQLDGIVDAMMNTANTTDSRGQPLFGGADGKTPYAKAADGSVAYSGQGDPPAIPTSASTSVAATESGTRAFGGIKATDGTSTDVFAIVKGLADKLRANASTDDLASSVTDLQSATAQVTNVRASVDARASAVQLQSSTLDAQATAREAQRSTLEDTDVTSAYVKLQQLSTTLSATQASFTKLAQLSLFNYLS